MKAKLRNTGTHARPIQPNYSVSELMWENGAHFELVPRDKDERHVELIATSDEGEEGEEGEEVSLYLDVGAMRIIKSCAASNDSLEKLRTGAGERQKDMTDDIKQAVRELREALAASTSGKWETSPDRGGFEVFARRQMPSEDGYDTVSEGIDKESDARFVVAAHNHLPAALDRLEELEAQQEAWMRKRDRAFAERDAIRAKFAEFRAELEMELCHDRVPRAVIVGLLSRFPAADTWTTDGREG